MSLIIGKPHTGYALDAVEGTASVLTSGNFVNDLENVAYIKIDTAYTEHFSPGRNGVTKRSKGRTITTLPSADLLVTNKSEAPFLAAAGLTSAAGPVWTLSAPATAGNDSSRTSTKTMTIVQYTHAEEIVLSAAKPASMSLEGEAASPIMLKLSLEGAATRVPKTGVSFAQLPTQFSPNSMLSNSLSISGTAVKIKSAKLDFGIQLEHPMDASNSNGVIAIPEIVGYNPKFTVVLYNELNTLNYFAGWQANTTMPVSWTFGSGTGNTYTVSFNGQISDFTDAQEGNIKTIEKIITPIAQSNGTLLTISIS